MLTRTQGGAFRRRNTIIAKVPARRRGSPNSCRQSALGDDLMEQCRFDARQPPYPRDLAVRNLGPPTRQPTITRSGPFVARRSGRPPGRLRRGEGRARTTALWSETIGDPSQQSHLKSLSNRLG